MIMAGTSVTNATEKMVKVQEKYLYDKLRNPDSKIDAKIQRLRIIYGLNAKQYSILKRELPYFVCGIFNPAIRRKENFAYTESFIIDIDKLSSKQMLIDDVRKRIEADENVYMCFKSPSEDGLKVMFRLSQRCYNAGIYSIFYKEFTHQFSVKHSLEQVTDSVTSDVSRACFISVDRDAYINENCIAIDINNYVNTDNPESVFETKRQQEDSTNTVIQAEKEKPCTDPETSIMEKIKEKLNPTKRKTEKPPVYVPTILEDIMDDLKKYIEETGVLVSETKSIQYGKKIMFKMGLKQAEINLFYGKRGFSVVISPRTGTDAELNNLMAMLVKAFIDTYQ